VREIKFDNQSKVYQTTWDMVDAIAWATNRRGRNTWKSSNVAQQIRDYILDHGGHPDMYPRSRVVAVMNKLTNEGYATLSTEGKRYTSFRFFPDVNLNRDTPEFVGRKSMIEPADLDDNVIFVNDDEVGGLPVPQEKPERWMANEINQWLDKFAEQSPETYAKYAERLVAGLKTVVK